VFAAFLNIILFLNISSLKVCGCFIEKVAINKKNGEKREEKINLNKQQKERARETTTTTTIPISMNLFTGATSLIRRNKELDCII
jgi:hypothetical protein